MSLPHLRIGHGYDIHRLEALPPIGAGRPLIVGGVQLEHDMGPIAHSDGDAVLHAITDALLGALGEPDLGSLFPDNDPMNAGRDSVDFVRAAIERVTARGFQVINLDVTVVLERPRLRPHRARIADTIADLLGIDPTLVNVKGKSHEGLDATGAGQAIEAHAVVLLG